MIRASALYLVIVIALVIGLLCSALVAAAYYYRAEYQQKFRYDRLVLNLQSGVNILLVGRDSVYANKKVFSLFGDDADSVSLQRIPWGVYDVGAVIAFSQKDTLYKTFSFANTIDSAKWAAVYLKDEDRPFSLSGKTIIRGDAYVPRSGVQKAYIDGKRYEGDERLVLGKQKQSEKELPGLNPDMLRQLEHLSGKNIPGDSVFLNHDSLARSFLVPTGLVNFKKETQTLKNVWLRGNLVLFSDTTVTLDSTANLDGVIVFAPSIVVNSGFKGNCQLFARDSIRVDSNCRFGYPSCLGLLRFTASKKSIQERISLGNNCFFNGIIFSYEKESMPAKPLIIIGKNAKLSGQIYSQGMLELNDGSKIDGSVFTSRFLYRNSFTLYENYLINTTIDSRALSPYYLGSGLLPVAAKRKKILQWLEAN